MQRFEVLAGKSAGPHDLDALQRAFRRIMADEGSPVRDVEIGESGGKVLIRMDLAVESMRRAKRRGEKVFAYAWYDAFGEREVSHFGRVAGSAD